MSDSYFELKKVASKFSEKLEKDDKKSFFKDDSDKKVKKIKKIKRKAKKAQNKLDKKLASLQDQFVKLAGGVTMKLKYLDDAGNKVKMRVPAKCIICPECDGSGEIDGTESDNDCTHCHGKGMHKIFDSDRASDEEIAAHAKFEQSQSDEEGDEEGDDDEEEDDEAEEDLEEEEKNAEDDFLSLKKEALFNPMTDALPKLFDVGRKLTSFLPSFMPGSSKNLNELNLNELMGLLSEIKDHTSQGLKDELKLKQEEEHEDEEHEEDSDNLIKNLEILYKLSDNGINALKSNDTDKADKALKFVKPLLDILGKSGGASGLSELGLGELGPLLSELGGVEGLLAGVSEMGPLLALL